MIYRCCNENRKGAVLHNPNLNGIDYLEVLDHDAIALGSPRQQTLMVHCLNQTSAALTPRNVVIEGGESITGIMVDWIARADVPPPLATFQEQNYFLALADAPKVLVIRTSKVGDFSTYKLRLVNNAREAVEDPFEVTETLAGFDPQLAEIDFSFKVECGPDFDCAPPPVNCPPDLPSPPPINYLAKDYGSFRSVMLDRLTQLLPNWSAASEADMGVMLAELMAYVGDQLSYQQDAVATEAYIETARSRISLRRHALLVDYHVHDGCNARVWMRLQVNAQAFLDRTKARFYTDAPGIPKNLAIGSGNEEAALLAGVKFFEPMQDAVLYPEHNEMAFYTWGDDNCCLPKGATEATLYGTYPNLQPGDVLIFQEVKGPQTGNPADADIRHRCAVRLTQITTLVDPLFEDQTGAPIASPAMQKPTPVTEIQWASQDALPFPVCLSSTFLGSGKKLQTVTGVSVVYGNIVLADHGLTFTGVDPGTVPEPRIFFPPNPAGDRCKPTPREPLPVRFRPTLPDAPVTQAVPLPLAGSPVTPGVVALSGAGFVSLTDASGFVSLMIQPVDPLSWPQYFGVETKFNSVNPANLDLAVVYDPPAGPGPVVLEKFTDLSLNTADANFVAKQINLFSKLIHVPASYVPPAGSLSGFPAAPARLPNAGPVDLQDTSATTYLTLEATNPLTWPPQFGVLAQGSDASLFNLVVVYNPASGGIGVALPVTVEEFDDVSLATVASQFTSGAQLIRVKSFSQEPNPGLSATGLMNFDASAAAPSITLNGDWRPVLDLLESGESAKAFVVEVESNGAATLRFGDGANGKIPDAGMHFTATYRIGNGADGNVGAESLIHLVTADARIMKCTNPLPGAGGVDPETTDQIRRRAPQAFLTQERAVTMADYQAVTEKTPRIEDAVASLRWTGSWYTVFIAAEPDGGGRLSTAIEKRIKKNVNRYRLAGQDLEVDSPQYVSLDIELEICVDPNYFRAYVEKSLQQVLRCLFSPDNFKFGQTVYLSPIYAAARTVAGVTAVRATKFQPQGVNTPLYLSMGEIKLGALQIARLENDRNFPDHGQLTLVMEGGK